ncbi:olee1-like protein isoform X2 [Cucumis melo var. makuwa]|uniref:Olee1-like protein isoform X2 n=1 Tax=Cucumis melo var. makuwa TaxID=1194695 RepID=A0A5A7UA45_CUCMM|nr:olee1-like protein isoform X2 [Cucumis melo var. makuwa]TYK13206.1 olee1-like protein isoform X2 [Cucumis melo var. makuwa]
MAKSCAIILVSALCFLSFLDIALSSKDRFFIEGKEANAGNETFTGEAVTDKNGVYKIEVDGDHEEEICEVSLLESGDKGCGEIPTDGYGHFARVSITGNNGIIDPVRQANPLGFKKKEALPQCKEVLRELGFDDAGILV